MSWYRIWHIVYLVLLELVNGDRGLVCRSLIALPHAQLSSLRWPWQSDGGYSNKVTLFFTGATLCVSAVFAVVPCLSVRPSVTLVECIHMVEDIVKLLTRPGNPVILVFFWLRAPVVNSKGEPLHGEAKYTGIGKKFRFSTEITVYFGNGTR